MAIYCFSKTRPKAAQKATPKALIAGFFLASFALGASGCSHLHQVNAGEIPAAPASNTATTTSARAPEAPISKGVSTNHDIYHSRALEVPAGKPVPAISVRLEADAVQGWNLYVGTANFTFTPSKVNGESSPTEGHAHLYVNEQPIQRIYGTWTHLPDLPAGENTIRVTLNANGFETLTTQGEPIEDITTIEIYKPNQPSPDESAPQSS